MIVTNPTTKRGGLLRWLTEPPARSFTLFKGHPRMSRIARFTERIIFLGGTGVAALLTLGGWVSLVGFLEALIELKVTALIFSQVAHVFVNLVRYILVPSGRSDMRASSEVTFRKITLDCKDGNPLALTLSDDSTTLIMLPGSFIPNMKKKA